MNSAAPPTPSGLLLIDKPLGPTSMDVCRRVRRALVAAGAPKRVKVGHGGTLDPLATGLLVILVGKATPLCNQIMADAKTYLADVDLSAFSSTDDAEGEKTLVEIVPPRGLPTAPELAAACAKFVGTIMQRPPAYSAIKVQGQRAYDMARAGNPQELPARPVRIDAISVVEYAWPRAVLAIECGKGVYIRSLARDLGGALGTGGMLAGLRRTRTGTFTVEKAMPLDALPRVLVQADLEMAK
ncbi:MAG: tRNA pseudouridine(55) synthase TruB [Phycisphaerales bacterium]